MSNLNPSQMLPVGTVLDRRYRIERYLASGGFGNTYVATDTRFDSRVAVKEFFMRGTNHRAPDHSTVVVSNSDNQAGFTAQLDKFRREAKRIFDIRHDHIVHVSDLFDANATSYYVMDFIEGESLSARVKRGPLSEQEVRDVAAQLLDALSAVHAAGFYHLDVKPGNIMIDAKGHCTLIDFGASKQMSALERTSLSASGMAYTPGYAPVEQEAQKIKSIGPWTDIYAVGATFYHLLTAQNPPEVEPDDTGDDSRMFAYPSGVSLQMQKAISRMMNPSPRKRPQTIDDARALLADQNPSAEVISVELDSVETRIQTETQTPERPQPVNPPQNHEFSVNGVSFKMIAVEGGTFMMGATPEQGSEAYADDKPAHQVTLSGYSIGEMQVTQALWRAVMGNNPSYFKGNDLPVEQVSWNDCQEFINQLNKLTESHRPAGREFRLPTEAEWEFAARGGNKSNHTKYAGSNDVDAVAWYDGNSSGASSWLGKVFSSGKTQPVGQKLPNELGLYDMSGNVYESCQDYYDKKYYRKPPSMDPCNNSKTNYHVYRGGSWSTNEVNCRVSYRDYSTPEFAYYNLGFRLAL